MDSKSRCLQSIIFIVAITLIFSLRATVSWAEHSVLIDVDEETDDRLVLPKDIIYKGAFKFPDSDGDSRWGYGGSALTFSPGGNSGGPDDGYPGSLYGSGHPYDNLVSEISIPSPVLSDQSTYDAYYSELNAAATLQPFSEITGGRIDRASGPDGIVPDSFGGLAYLEQQGIQSGAKLYWNIFKYYHVMPGDIYSHGWSETDLSAPNAQGLWHVGPFNDGSYSSKRTANYMFDIPRDWADAYLDGKYLATGKADGPGSSGNSHGPAVYAFAPYQQGNPPPAEAELDAAILLMYPPDQSYFPDWSHCDEWEGAVWLTAGSKSAVLIAGRKALGEAYYGLPRPGDCSPYKGYHCDPYETQFLLYDPNDLALVARGIKPYYEVVPYAIFRPDDYFWPTCSGTVGGAAFDRDNGHLYIVQTSLGEKPIVHVFEVAPGNIQPAPEDLNNDGTVNIIDVAIGINCVIGQTTNPKADVTSDGLVDTDDVTAIVNEILY